MFLVYKILSCFILYCIGFCNIGTCAKQFASVSTPLPSLDATTLDKYFPRTLSSNPLTSAHSSALRSLSYSNYSVSFPALMRLNNYEHDFYKFLKYEKGKLVREGDHKTVGVIQRYIVRYEEETVKGIQRWSSVLGKPLNSSAVVTHPFLAYKMIRRLVYDYPKLHKILAEGDYLPISLQIDLNKWPGPNDVFHFASLLVVLHFFYDFYTHNFGKGTFGKIETGVALTENHLMELYYVALKNRCYASALQLIEFALSMTKQEGFSDEIEKMLKQTIEEHDKLVDDNFANTYAIFTKKIGTWKEYIANRRSFVTRKFKMKNEVRVSFREDKNGKKEVASEAILVHRFMMLCKGENWKTNKEKAKLTCWNHYLHGGLFGFKIELLSQNPKIFKVHDLLKEKARAEILKYSYSRLKISKKSFLHAQDASKGATSAFLTRKTFSNRNLWKTINKNIALVLNSTAVDITKSDAKFQVTCFTPGGYYSPHHNALISAGKSNRFTSVLIYLNSVQAGGRTAFPRIGISVKPSPGSAIIWNNYKPDGNLDNSVEHGECPVVLGLKFMTEKA